MQSLVQVMQAEAGGSSRKEPLPELLPILTDKGILFEPGQIVMIAGPPNSGKSMLAVWYPVARSVPSMIFSADTDKRTTEYRAASIKTGYTFNEVKGMVGTGAEDMIADAMMEVTDAGVQFCFDPELSVEDIDLELQAYEEVYGEPPQVVIIDNLLNCVSGDAGDFSGMIDVLSALHSMARNLDTCVVILHHVNESGTKHASEYPYPRGQIRGKVSQYPEIILSIAMLPEEQQMRVACVKHRHATPSPSGEDYATVWVDTNRMTFFNSVGDLKAAETKRAWE